MTASRPAGPPPDSDLPESLGHWQPLAVCGVSSGPARLLPGPGHSRAPSPRPIRVRVGPGPAAPGLHGGAELPLHLVMADSDPRHRKARVIRVRVGRQLAAGRHNFAACIIMIA